MSKYFKEVIPFLVVLCCIASCSKTKSYADYLKEERKNIKNYVNTNELVIQSTKPEEDGEWKTETGQDIYCQSSTGLYYHQINKGNGGETPGVRSTVYVRYTGMTLSGNLIYNTTAETEADPDRFIIVSDPTGATYGPGFQEAVKNLTRGGVCRVIIPFTLGNGYISSLSGVSISDAASYTTMIYEISLENIK